jgi:hypothetical protein
MRWHSIARSICSAKPEGAIEKAKRGNMRFAFLGFVVASIAIFNGAAMAQTSIEEGQVWTFRGAPAETARLVIRKIERREGGGEAVHISLYGLPTLTGLNGEVSHIPFDREALEASLDTLAAEAPREDEDFAADYREWKSARGGVFSLPVAQAVKALLEAAFSRPPPPIERI